jgi:cytochrome c oxidase assembly protein subunit 11
MTSADLGRKNMRVLKYTLGFVCGMIALAYASVPLYDMLCRVTGWGGTTMIVAQNPNQPIARDITVQFNTNVARDMPWSFRPEKRELTLKIGQDGFISFSAYNPTDKPVTGTAVYNVTPLKAGKYFYKTQCFCFNEQVLNPQERTDMPVVFFVDPAIADDPELKDLKNITLSYTFFRKDSKDLEKALEAYYTAKEDVKIN